MLLDGFHHRAGGVHDGVAAVDKGRWPRHQVVDRAQAVVGIKAAFDQGVADHADADPGFGQFRTDGVVVVGFDAADVHENHAVQIAKAIGVVVHHHLLDWFAHDCAPAVRPRLGLRGSWWR